MNSLSPLNALSPLPMSVRPNVQPGRSFILSLGIVHSHICEPGMINKYLKNITHGIFSPNTLLLLFWFLLLFVSFTGADAQSQL